MGLATATGLGEGWQAACNKAPAVAAERSKVGEEGRMEHILSARHANSHAKLDPSGV
jgi:hypothetical protein